MSVNHQFLERIKEAFKEFIKSGTSRSTAKLKPLHGTIASNLAEKLGNQYKVYAQGYEGGKEKTIQGRYLEKRVDIVIEDLVSQKTVAGIAVKFVMQNYSQNSNNYFENMLGETANIRTENYPYFQVFIILDKIPYYNKSGEIKHWEEFTEHHINKYYQLAHDNTDLYLHTPDKTLVYVINVSPDISKKIKSKEEYRHFYSKEIDNIIIENTKYQYPSFTGNVILNDYNLFIEKVFHKIKSL